METGQGSHEHTCHEINVALCRLFVVGSIQPYDLINKATSNKIPSNWKDIIISLSQEGQISYFPLNPETSSAHQ
jgi:hypothetical protein